MAMIRLIRVYYRGEYRDIPRQHFVIIVAAVLILLNAGRRYFRLDSNNGLR